MPSWNVFDDIKSYGIKPSSDKTCIYLKALWNCGVHLVDMKVPCNQDFVKFMLMTRLKGRCGAKRMSLENPFMSPISAIVILLNFYPCPTQST